MSDAPPRKLPLIAIGAAVLALMFALVAVIVVITRNGEAAPPKQEAASITDITVKAADVLALKGEALEAVIEAGTAKGVRIKDAALSRALGLEPDDIVTTMSGRVMTAERYSDVTWRLSLYNPTTVYVELLRKGETKLVRWKLDGELKATRTSSLSSITGTGSLGSLSGTGTLGSGSYSSTPDFPDTLLDTIERVDDTTVKIPRATVDKMLANPMAAAKGARVVPAVKNGKADGFKIYAVRPSSVYARLGFTNGDTIHAVNGFELTSPDKALEVYTKLKDATSLEIEVTRRGVPMALKIIVK